VFVVALVPQAFAHVFGFEDFLLSGSADDALHWNLELQVAMSSRAQFCNVQQIV
jgi:hypothetical protein